MLADSLDVDHAAAGLTSASVDAARYESASYDKGEVPFLIRSLMPDNVRVLDIGCGPGAVTLRINDGKNNAVIGLEPNIARASVARERGLDVIAAELSAAVIRDHGPFDVVVACDVLEHIPSPAPFLTLIASSLKPDGLLLLSTPNVAHWTVRLALLFGRFNYTPDGIMDATHVRWFTRKTLINLLLSQGFVIEAATASAGAWLPAYGKLPWRVMPRRIRSRLVREISVMTPTLFGCQHIVKARKRDTSKAVPV